MTFSTYEELLELIERGTEQFGYPVDKGQLKILEFCCGYIDILIWDFDGESISFELEKGTLDVIIRATLKSWFAAEGRKHPFCRLMAHAKSVAFEGTEGGENVVVEYRFPGVWDC